MQLVAHLFLDALLFSAAANYQLSASASGTSSSGINFSVFDLYSGSQGSGTLLKSGTILPSGIATISFASLLASALSGSYYLVIGGTQSDLRSYNGNLTLTTSVPKPTTHGMLLSGLALIGLVVRRDM